jgi:hypothetical protein
MSTQKLNAILQRVVDRSHAQKAQRIADMRAELVDYGYSIVTTEWLKEVLREMPLVGRKGTE